MPIYTFDELMAHSEAVEYLISPILPKGGTLLLSAPRKSMKTFLGLHMGMALATGKPFMEWETKKVRVLYIDYEIGIGEVKSRLRPMGKHYGSPGEYFRLRNRDAQVFGLDTGNALENLFKEVEKHRPDVIFLDTLRKSTHQDENSSTEMLKVFENLRRLKLNYDVSAVILHHMGKSREGEKGNARGSSIIQDDPDSLGDISKYPADKDGNQKIEIEWTLRNHSPISNSKFTFDSKLGLFIPTPKKVKNEPTTRTETESIDVTDGLLPAVPD